PGRAGAGGTGAAGRPGLRRTGKDDPMTANPPRDSADRRREQRAAQLERDRPRLVALAARILADPSEAQDIVQQAWLRLESTDQDIENLPAWLTTVTTRLCLDRLRQIGRAHV